MANPLTWAQIAAPSDVVRPRPCGCGGYHFPHRRGGGACDLSPRSAYYRALRDGATRAEAMEHLSVAQIEDMWPMPQQPSLYDDDPIPF